MKVASGNRYNPEIRMNLRSLLLAGLLTLPAVSVFAETETFAENIELFKNALRDADMSLKDMKKFLDPSAGPTQFRLDAQNAPWAGNYFAMQDGGIAFQWNEDAQDPVRRLSAIEKYDLYVGNENKEATEWERANRGDKRKPKPKFWEGFCNGVRCAGFLMDEPVKPITVTGANGQSITFEPADLKALAGAAYFYVEKYAQLGAPTQKGEPKSKPNPAVVDLALRYHLAEMGKAFVVDSHPGAEIWNESVIGFEREVGKEMAVTAEEAAKFPGAVRKVIVSTQVETMGEIDIVDSNGPTKHEVANGKHSNEVIPLRYELFLDKKGNIIEGRWLPLPRGQASKDRGIDFVWFAGGKGTDMHNGGNPHLRFEVLKKLVKKASGPISCQRLLH